MSRLIDVNTLKLDLYDYTKDGLFMVRIDEFERLIDRQPAAVVRCGECRCWRETMQYCEKLSTPFRAQRTPQDWFCADGERKVQE